MYSLRLILIIGKFILIHNITKCLNHNRGNTTTTTMVIVGSVHRLLINSNFGTFSGTTFPCSHPRLGPKFRSKSCSIEWVLLSYRIAYTLF
uniref:Putative secreted protein n=1 Tax=Anopheles triannulatus TaxID=58253 RepID=A0A2M4B2L0_9DIPT